MAILSIEMIIALPVVLALALIVAFTIVNIASNVEGPPIVDVRKEFTCEDKVLIDVDNDSSYDTCFWFISGTIYLGSRSSTSSYFFKIEPVYKVILNDTVDGVIYFAAYVPYTANAIVITTSVGQAVVNLR